MQADRATPASKEKYPGRWEDLPGNNAESLQPPAHPDSDFQKQAANSAGPEAVPDASIDGGTCVACEDLALTATTAATMPHNQENSAGGAQESGAAHSAHSAIADLVASFDCTEDEEEPGVAEMQSQSAVAALQVMCPSSREDLPGNYVDSFNLPAQLDPELCQQAVDCATPEADADVSIDASIHGATCSALTDLALTAATLPPNQENSSSTAEASEVVYSPQCSMAEQTP